MDTAINIQTDDRAALMQRLRSLGLSNPQIGWALGFSRQTVHSILGGQPLAKETEFVSSETPSEEHFAAFLRAFRQRHNLSQAQLARLIDVNVDPNGKTSGTISRWETDKTKPISPLLIMRHLTLLEEKNVLT